MKFAEQLAENIVPEWKEKYLDYAAGKKKIKKIASSPLVNSITHNVHPGSHGLRLGNFSFIHHHHHHQNGDTPMDTSCPLVPERHSHNVTKNDRTPLLQKHKDHAPVVVDETSNNLFDAINDEFIAWLDKEKFKIEDFYGYKEDHCVTRYLLLQDQMFHLHEEKLKMSSKPQAQSEELLKLSLSHSTKTLNILSKYDLPSWPRNLFRGSDTRNSSDIRANRRDYEHRKHAVPYFVARRQLKAAVLEFYRKLELLKSYQTLNRTGFRKLVKKFDKWTGASLSSIYMEQVNGAYFASSDVLDNLITKVEELYSSNFEDGNRKVAVEKLRSNLTEDHFYTSMFSSGLLLGASAPLLAYAVYFGLQKTATGELPEGRYLLQIWGGFFLVLLKAFFFALNCFVWVRYKVNYRLIFEFNRKTALNYREYPFLPSLLFFFLCMFGWFSFNDFWPHSLSARDWPWFFVGTGALILLNPLDVLFLESRKWLIVTVWRLLLSGLYPVEFRDFFIGDVFCSLSYSMGNIPFFFCIYATNWTDASGGNSVCGSSKSHLMGFFSALPPLWRCLHCIRRFADSGDWFPHLANMLKFAVTAVYFMTLSLYRIERSNSHKATFIFVALVNSTYSSLWDIFMDWSLMQNKSLLRDDLVYPKWFYYFSMVADVLLRFQWIFYALFSQQIQQSAVTSFCVGVAEVIRRFIWNLIRMENEHVANIHMFRASKEAPLPYETVIRTPRSESESGLSVERTDAQRPDDVEMGYSSIQDETSSSANKRRGSILTSGVMRNVTNAIINAHVKDFQRHKSKSGDDTELQNSSDEDNSDNER